MSLAVPDELTEEIRLLEQEYAQFHQRFEMLQMREHALSQEVNSIYERFKMGELKEEIARLSQQSNH